MTSSPRIITIWNRCEPYWGTHASTPTQVYTSIRPPQLKRAVAFYEEKALQMLSE
jgi:hypothetical protein